MKKTIISALSLMLSLMVHAQNVQRFVPNEVHLNQSEMLERQLWDEHYILSLDADRLLYHFRGECGLEQLPNTAPYGGWESTDLRGHTLGHWLSALSLMVGGQASSDAVKEEAQKQLTYTVNVLAACQQQRSKLHPESAGYLSAFREQMLDVADNTGQGRSKLSHPTTVCSTAAQPQVWRAICAMQQASISTQTTSSMSISSSPPHSTGSRRVSYVIRQPIFPVKKEQSSVSTRLMPPSKCA